MNTDTDTDRPAPSTRPTPERLDLADLYADGDPTQGARAILGVQIREHLHEAVILEYLDALLDGAQLPPIQVVRAHAAPHELQVVDGWHRLEAHRRANRLQIEAIVVVGDHRHAILAACAANAEHGLRRTDADKRRAVRTVLGDPVWAGWSDRAIASACRVHHSFVGRVRRELLEETGASASAERRGLDGRVIDTSRIGRPRTVGEEVEAGLRAEDAETDRILAEGPRIATAPEAEATPVVGPDAEALLEDDGADDEQAPVTFRGGARVGKTIADDAPVEASDDALPDGERAPWDAYWTPPRVALACLAWLLGYLAELGISVDDDDTGRAVEPSVGGGAWVEALRVLLPNVGVDRVDVDPEARGLRLDLRGERRGEWDRDLAWVGDWTAAPSTWEPVVGRDRWAPGVDLSYALVVGNPPYDEAVLLAFLDACLARAPGGVVALLLRETALGGTPGVDRHGRPYPTAARLAWWRAHPPAVVAVLCPRPKWEGPGARPAADMADTVLVVWIPGHTDTRWRWLDVPEVLAGLGDIVDAGEE